MSEDFHLGREENKNNKKKGCQVALCGPGENVHYCKQTCFEYDG
jgi:hypothetical protein